MLRKVSSMVKPIMQKRNWRVQVLAEFLPSEQNLLGLNINKGYKICIRLRYHHNPGLFLPFEEVVDTMLHELSHNVHGPHDSHFHKLWDELRDELETLIRKGYTGEGFLSAGHRLGGSHSRLPPPNELRRLARVNAEKRRAQSGLASGSGQKLGGRPIHQGADVRQVIAHQAIRRTAINKGCGSTREDAIELSDQGGRTTFKTQAEEDDANNLAISKALMELMEEEEMEKLNGTWNGGGLGWSAEKGLYDAGSSGGEKNGRHDHPSEEEQMRWAMEDSMKGAGVAKEARNEMDGSKAPRQTYSIDSSTDDEVDQPTQNPHNFPIKRKRAPTPSSPIAHHPKKQQEKTASAPLPPASAPILPSPNFGPPATTDDWACQLCTFINPIQFLACDACGTERSQSVLVAAKANTTVKQQPQRLNRKPVSIKKEEDLGVKAEVKKKEKSLGWKCACGAFMEHRWWTCSACGRLKESS
jgi:hypothetical protein